MIRAAKHSEHLRVVEIAKAFKVTSGFTHMMFSGKPAYEKGWIRVFDEGGGSPGQRGAGFLGFTCVRHKVREPVTSLYYIAVHPKCCRTGIGLLLLEDLKKQSPHKVVVLNVTKDNEAAINFYLKHGFVKNGESLNGSGWQMVLTW